MGLGGGATNSPSHVLYMGISYSLYCAHRMLNPTQSTLTTETCSQEHAQSLCICNPDIYSDISWYFTTNQLKWETCCLCFYRVYGLNPEEAGVSRLSLKLIEGVWRNHQNSCPLTAWKQLYDINKCFTFCTPAMGNKRLRFAFSRHVPKYKEEIDTCHEIGLPPSSSPSIYSLSNVIVVQEDIAHSVSYFIYVYKLSHIAISVLTGQ